jgi:hypothetical protein
MTTTTTTTTRSNYFTKAIIDTISKAGATVTIMDEGVIPLNYIKLSYGDDAYKVLEGWVNNNQANFDPIVRSICQPSEEIVQHSVVLLCPPITQFGMIQCEAKSVVYHYRSIRLEDFDGDDTPEIGTYIYITDGSIVEHAKIAVSKLPRAIQNCQYDTIRALEPGSYICDLVQTWGNTVISMAVFKPLST